MALTEDQIVELEQILSSIESLLPRCHDRLLTTNELLGAILRIDSQITNILPLDSDEYRIFDRDHGGFPASLGMSMAFGPRYVDPADCGELEHRRIILRYILQRQEPDFLREAKRPRDEWYFSKEEKYEAMDRVFTIMKRASHSLGIVDGYLDENVFLYIASLDTAVEVKMLTGTRKPIFVPLGQTLKSQGRKLEARECTDCHDRFLIVDSTEVFHLGTSLNGIGKRAFRLSLVKDDSQRSKFLTDFNKWWNAGTVLI